MRETTIAFVSFFMFCFFVIQLRVIKRIRNMRRKKEQQGIITPILFSIAECVYCFECAFDCVNSCDRTRKRIDEKKTRNRMYEIDGEERKTKEEEYLDDREEERIKRDERVEELRANGYTATEEDKNKVLEYVSIVPKANISWVSSVAIIPEEEIVIIIENEQGFEIRDEYIINTKMLEEEEKKQQIDDSICESCGSPVKKEADFCPNCGCDIRKK